jgi:hypothetical protein
MGKDDFQRRVRPRRALRAVGRVCDDAFTPRRAETARRLSTTSEASTEGGRRARNSPFARPAWSDIDSDYRRFLERLDSERPGKSLPESEL